MIVVLHNEAGVVGLFGCPGSREAASGRDRDLVGDDLGYQIDELLERYAQ